MGIFDELSAGDSSACQREGASHMLPAVFYQMTEYYPHH